MALEARGYQSWPTALVVSNQLAIAAFPFDTSNQNLGTKIA
jgi:hypothetical protein